MSLNSKYRMRDISKDFDLKINKIQEILAKFESGVDAETYKSMKVLTDEEVGIIFDYLTQTNKVGDMKLFFDDCVREKEEREKKAADEKAAAEKAAKEAAEKAAAEEKARKEEEARKAAEKKAQEEIEEQMKREQAQKKLAAQKAKDTAQQFAKPSFGTKPSVKEENKQAKDKQRPTTVTVPSRKMEEPAVVVANDETDSSIVAKRNVKVVDTRSSNNVNVEKYNAKFDDIAEGAKFKKDYGKSKQKIKSGKENRKKTSQAIKEEEMAKLRRMEQYEKDKKKHLSNVVLPESLSVSELAARLRMTNADVVKKLMLLGIMASASQIIDYDTAALVAEELGATVSKEVVVTIEEKLIDDTEDADENLVPRSPVVVVMGHVDHGKTSLLDAIRHTSVVTGEAGGITQHIGAYTVNLNDRNITFLDTPGHAAFTSMRARGAQVTDVVILVVAADDGIMPQTVEAINHAQAANVPIVVAVNKMDKPTANYDRVLQNLTEHNLVPEDWGGDTICVPVSAMQKTGIDQLLEMVLLVADMKELKANPNREAKGTVIEAKLDKGRGPVATVLVQNGTLRMGDVVVAGMSVGKVRTMVDDKGKRISEAGPSTPVELVGLSEVPNAGDIFHVVNNERMARELVEERKHAHKEEEFKERANVSLDDLFAQIQQGSVKNLNVIIKADVQGSVEALRASLVKLSNEEVKVNAIHCAVGGVTESDVILAMASKAIIVGFNVRPDSNAKNMADKEKIDIRLYRIIYDCIEEIEAAMKGMLAPKFREVVLGYAEVRTTFRVSGVGTIAGCYVKQGKIARNAEVRLTRDNIVIHQGKLDSLKRFKDDAREVAEGYECGVGLANYNDIKEGDIIEAFINEEIKQ